MTTTAPSIRLARVTQESDSPARPAAMAETAVAADGSAAGLAGVSARPLGTTTPTRLAHASPRRRASKANAEPETAVEQQQQKQQKQQKQQQQADAFDPRAAGAEARDASAGYEEQAGADDEAVEEEEEEGEGEEEEAAAAAADSAHVAALATLPLSDLVQRARAAATSAADGDAVDASLDATATPRHSLASLLLKSRRASARALSRAQGREADAMEQRRRLTAAYAELKEQRRWFDDEYRRGGISEDALARELSLLEEVEEETGAMLAASQDEAAEAVAERQAATETAELHSELIHPRPLNIPLPPVRHPPTAKPPATTMAQQLARHQSVDGGETGGETGGEKGEEEGEEEGEEGEEEGEEAEGEPSSPLPHSPAGLRAAAKKLAENAAMVARVDAIRAVLLRQMPRVIDLFRRMDKNEDGVVSRDEFQHVWQLLTSKGGGERQEGPDAEQQRAKEAERAKEAQKQKRRPDTHNKPPQQPPRVARVPQLKSPKQTLQKPVTPSAVGTPASSHRRGSTPRTPATTTDHETEGLEEAEEANEAEEAKGDAAVTTDVAAAGEGAGEKEAGEGETSRSKEVDLLFGVLDLDGSGAIELAEMHKLLRRGADVKLSAELMDGARGEIAIEAKNRGGEAYREAVRLRAQAEAKRAVWEAQRRHVLRDASAVLRDRAILHAAAISREAGDGAGGGSLPGGGGHGGAGGLGGKGRAELGGLVGKSALASSGERFVTAIRRGAPGVDGHPDGGIASPVKRLGRREGAPTGAGVLPVHLTRSAAEVAGGLLVSQLGMPARVSPRRAPHRVPTLHPAVDVHGQAFARSAMQSVVDRGTVDARLPFFDPCEGQRQVAMVDLMKAGERERRRLQEEVRAAVERMVTQVEDEETPEEKEEREMYARAEIEATLTAEAEADDARIVAEKVAAEEAAGAGVWLKRDTLARDAQSANMLALLLVRAVALRQVAVAESEAEAEMAEDEEVTELTQGNDVGE